MTRAARRPSSRTPDAGSGAASSQGVPETVTMTDKLLPLADAADRLGVASSTLRHQIRNRKLRGVKRGRDWFVREREVERYRTESQSPARSRADQKVDILDAAVAGCVDVILAEIDRRCDVLTNRVTHTRETRAQAAALQDLRAWVEGVER